MVGYCFKRDGQSDHDLVQPPSIDWRMNDFAYQMGLINDDQRRYKQRDCRTREIIAKEKRRLSDTDVANFAAEVRAAYEQVDPTFTLHHEHADNYIPSFQTHIDSTTPHTHVRTHSGSLGRARVQGKCGRRCRNPGPCLNLAQYDALWLSHSRCLPHQ
jgi:hypothetical protein